MDNLSKFLEMISGQGPQEHQLEFMRHLAGLDAGEISRRLSYPPMRDESVDWSSMGAYTVTSVNSQPTLTVSGDFSDSMSQFKPRSSKTMTSRVALETAL